MDTSSWKWFKYTELFDISGSKTTTIEDLKAYGKGEYPYVTTQAVNNGVEGYFNYCTERGGVLTVDSAVLGFCSYQEKDFSASDHVEVLRPKFEMTKYIALFLTTIINREQYRYSYGRKCSQTKLRRSQLKLPVTQEGTPDWKYMEDFVKDQIIPQLPKKAQKVWLQKYDTQPMQQEKMKLNTDEWKWFLPSDIFTEISIAPSSDLNNLELDPFGLNYLSRAVVNNGYECKVKRDESKVTRGNFISVVMVGVPSFAFYQKNDVICSQNILVLRYPAINQYNALFLCTILQKDGYRYSYGRTLSKANFLQTRIKLPVTPAGTPNWQFMEDYIKSMPFSRNIEPSKPNEVVDELVEMKKEMIKMRRAMEAKQSGQIVNYGTININDNSKNYRLE